MLYSTHFLRSRRYGLFWTLLCVLLVMMPIPVHAAAGELDPTFGGDGKVITPLGTGSESIAAMAVQADGKLVVAGSFGVARLLATGGLDSTFGDQGVTLSSDLHFGALVTQSDGKVVAAGSVSGPPAIVLARYNSDGSPDSSFDDDGKVFTNLGGSTQVKALIRQPDGKLVAAGSVSTIGNPDIALVRYNADGSLDTSFDGDGIVFTDFGNVDNANALVLQPDGKLVVAVNSGNSDIALVRYNADGSLDSSFKGRGSGGASALVRQPDGKLVVAGGRGSDGAADLALARYNADGSLDNSFDGDGIVLTDFGGSEYANALVLQSDGKLVAAGYTTSGGNEDFGLVRYNADGSLDSSFDGDGKVLTDFGRSENARMLILQPDGKLVAGGGPWLARYNTDGSLDATFADGGTYLYQQGDSTIQAIVIQPDGKLVAAGFAFTYDHRDDFALVRYNADGSLDNSFGVDGKVLTDFGTYDRVSALILQPDGKLVAAGTGRDGFTLARYNADGTLDNSFGSDGKAIVGLGGTAAALVRQPDGKLVAAGSSDAGFPLVRYNADGSLDSSFDDDGIVFIALDSYGAVSALVLQPDGKLVVAGYAHIGGADDFALVRYNSDGSLDNSFDGDGKVFTDLGDNDQAYALVLQPDGKLIAAGSSPTSRANNFALVRYNSDGSLDTTFDGDGKLLTDLGGNEYATSLVLQPDNKLVAAGYALGSGGSGFALLRYNADGSLDTTFDGDGKVITDFAGSARVSALVRQPDGKLVAGGTAIQTFALARYLGGNPAPVAMDDSYNVGVNAVLSVAAPGVLGNDSAADGDALTAALVSGPSNGRLTLNADGAFTYTPNPGFSGVERFTYQAKAGQATSNVATVTITVPTATERIDILSGAIQQLMTTGVLNQGQGNALLTKLTNARREVARCKMKQATKMLDVFNKHVTDLLAAGVLTPEGGQPLLAAANVIMAQVQADACITGVNAEEDAAAFTLYLPYVRR
ncbi:MAG: hypothetical protein DYG89_02770 [Caldilinea sp. CFX5]|nr:hypothetical protein [Caldilinea sp. CFX5]